MVQYKPSCVTYGMGTNLGSSLCSFASPDDNQFAAPQVSCPDDDLLGFPRLDFILDIGLGSKTNLLRGLASFFHRRFRGCLLCGIQRLDTLNGGRAVQLPRPKQEFLHSAARASVQDVQ